jgi:hypothetical protein
MFPRKSASVENPCDEKKAALRACLDTYEFRQFLHTETLPARKRMNIVVGSDTACYGDTIDMDFFKFIPVPRREAVNGDHLVLGRFETAKDSGWVDIGFPAEGAHFTFTLSRANQDWEVVRVGVVER